MYWAPSVPRPSGAFSVGLCRPLVSPATSCSEPNLTTSPMLLRESCSTPGLAAKYGGSCFAVPSALHRSGNEAFSSQRQALSLATLALPGEPRQNRRASMHPTLCEQMLGMWTLWPCLLGRDSFANPNPAPFQYPSRLRLTLFWGRRFADFRKWLP